MRDDPYARWLAVTCFFLCMIPAAFGAITIIAAPARLAHYRNAMQIEGSESYQRDMRAAYRATVANLVVRVLAIPLLAGFGAIAMWPARPLQWIIWPLAVVLIALHAVIPAVRAGPAFLLALWVTPFYFMPMAAGVLSMIALYTLTRERLVLRTP